MLEWQKAAPFEASPGKLASNPVNAMRFAGNWTAFAAGLALSPIATTIACLVLRQWIKALIAGGVVAGMVVSAVEVWL